METTKTKSKATQPAYSNMRLVLSKQAGKNITILAWQIIPSNAKMSAVARFARQLWEGVEEFPPNTRRPDIFVESFDPMEVANGATLHWGSLAEGAPPETLELHFALLPEEEVDEEEEDEVEK